MAVVQLASQEDVEEALGRVLTSDEEARVDAILDKASELFRAASGQQFTAGTSDVRMRVVADTVTLIQRPVVSVESILTDDDEDTPVTFGALYQGRVLVEGILGGSIVRVQHTHGGEVPDLVRLTVADVARKVLMIDPTATTGVTQHSETVGPFTTQDSYAAWAQGGQTMLSPSDLEIAKSFRVRTYGAVVMVP